MVGTRPINRLRKIPDGTTFIDLSPKKPTQKKKARRKIVMEEQPTSPQKGNTEESPTALDGALLEGFAAGAETASTLQDVLTEGNEKKEPPQTKDSPKKAKGETSSKGKKKKRETPTANTETKEEAEREVSDEESSSDVGDNEEEEAQEEEIQEEGDEDVQMLGIKKPPAKRARVQTHSSRRGKAPIVSTEDLVINKEVVMPKKLDLKLLSDLGIKEKVKKLFHGIGWGKFLKWDTDVYEELVREFYGSLEIEHAKMVPLGIKFKLLGKQRKVKVNELNLALKMVSLLDLTTKGYQEAVMVLPNYSDAKWNAIWTDAMRMSHRIISYNLYGKKDSSNLVSKSEMFIL